MSSIMVYIQTMQIPLFMFYSTFPCGYHTNPKLAILLDFVVAFADWPFPANNYLFKISD